MQLRTLCSTVQDETRSWRICLDHPEFVSLTLQTITLLNFNFSKYITKLGVQCYLCWNSSNAEIHLRFSWMLYYCVHICPVTTHFEKFCSKFNALWQVRNFFQVRCHIPVHVQRIILFEATISKHMYIYSSWNFSDIR